HEIGCKGSRSWTEDKNVVGDRDWPNRISTFIRDLGLISDAGQRESIHERVVLYPNGTGIAATTVQLEGFSCAPDDDVVPPEIGTTSVAPAVHLEAILRGILSPVV